MLLKNWCKWYSQHYRKTKVDFFVNSSSQIKLIPVIVRWKENSNRDGSCIYPPRRQCLFDLQDYFNLFGMEKLFFRLVIPRTPNHLRLILDKSFGNIRVQSWYLGLLQRRFIWKNSPFSDDARTPSDCSWTMSNTRSGVVTRLRLWSIVGKHSIYLADRFLLHKWSFIIKTIAIWYVLLLPI